MTDFLGVDKLNTTCSFCGTHFPSGYGRKYCQDLCKRRSKEARKKASGYYQRPEVMERQRAAHRRKYRENVAAGLESGSSLVRWEITGRGVDARCTEADCGQKLYARLLCKSHYNRAYGNDLSGDDYRKRAEFYGVPFESFSRLSVFDRDGWMCGICHDPVDRHLAYPDPLSVSLDHVIPLSKGGGHLLSNVQCSHLGCNVRKGARDERRKIVSVS